MMSSCAYSFKTMMHSVVHSWIIIFWSFADSDNHQLVKITISLDWGSLSDFKRRVRIAKFCFDYKFLQKPSINSQKNSVVIKSFKFKSKFKIKFKRANFFPNLKITTFKFLNNFKLIILCCYLGSYPSPKIKFFFLLL